MVLRPSDPQPQILSLAAGLALVEAIDAAVPKLPLILKWPNDVLLSGKKLAGILLERSGDRVAVGFGVNLATAPIIVGRQTARLGNGMTPEAFAPLLAGSFARLVDLWREADRAALIRAWETRAHWPGARLSVHISKDEMLTGRFAGLEPDGALRLMLDDGTIEMVRAGDVWLQ